MTKKAGKPVVEEVEVDVNPRVKLTREEMEQIQEIQKNMQSVTFELGNIEIQTISIKKRKDAILAKFGEITEHDNNFAKELLSKYGKGSIDLEKGEFIKGESAQ